MDNAPAFTVHPLLDVPLQGRSVQFLVDWEDYGPDWVQPVKTLEIITEEWAKIPPQQRKRLIVVKETITSSYCC